MATWFTGVEVCHSLVVTWRPGHWCWVLSQLVVTWRNGDLVTGVEILSQPRCHMATWSLVLSFVTASLSHGDLVTGVELCHSLVVTWRNGDLVTGVEVCHSLVVTWRIGDLVHWCWALSQPRCHMATWSLVLSFVTASLSLGGMATWFTGVEVCHSLVVTWRPGHWCWALSQPRCHMATWSLVLSFVTASLSHGDLVTGVELCHSLVVTWRNADLVTGVEVCHSLVVPWRNGDLVTGVEVCHSLVVTWRIGDLVTGVEVCHILVVTWRPGHWCWGLSQPRCHPVNKWHLNCVYWELVVSMKRSDVTGNPFEWYSVKIMPYKSPSPYFIILNC